MNVNNPFVSENILDSLKSSTDIFVHSVFSNGINIQAGDRPIFIGIQDGPSALQIDALYVPVITKAKVNSKVKYQEKQLIFKDLGLVLDLRYSKIKRYEFCDKIIPSHMTDKLVRMIIDYDFKTGLDMNTETLIQFLISEFGYKQESYVNYLFGRGKGLTPSGDDFLLGMIAYHHVKPYLEPTFFKTIEKKMSQNLTTDVSVNYLRDALEGYFVRDLINLFNALQDGGNLVARVYTITNFGHSSGKDTLSGIVMGILMEEELRRKK